MLKRTFSAISVGRVSCRHDNHHPAVERAAAEMATTKEFTKKKSEDKSGMTFNERRKKCSAEWKEMKAAGKTSAWKWPKYWSDCNKRLKQGG
jgi:hypothetical protein